MRRTYQSANDQKRNNQSANEGIGKDTTKDGRNPGELYEESEISTAVSLSKEGKMLLTERLNPFNTLLGTDQIEEGSSRPQMPSAGTKSIRKKGGYSDNSIEDEH